MADLNSMPANKRETFDLLYTEAATLAERVAELEKKSAEVVEDGTELSESAAARLTLELSDAQFAHQHALMALKNVFPEFVTTRGESKKKLEMVTEGLTFARDDLADRALAYGVAHTSKESRETFADLRERRDLEDLTPMPFREMRERDMSKLKNDVENPPPNASDVFEEFKSSKVNAFVRQSDTTTATTNQIVDDEAIARELQRQFDYAGNPRNWSGSSSPASSPSPSQSTFLDGGEGALRLALKLSFEESGGGLPVDDDDALKLATAESILESIGIGIGDGGESTDGEEENAEDDGMLYALAQSLLESHGGIGGGGESKVAEVAEDELFSESDDDEAQYDHIFNHSNLSDAEAADKPADASKMTDADASKMTDTDASKMTDADDEQKSPDAADGAVNVDIEGVVRFAQEYMHPRKEFGSAAASVAASSSSDTSVRAGSCEVVTNAASLVVTPLMKAIHSLRESLAADDVEQTSEKTKHDADVAMSNSSDSVSGNAMEMSQ